jgi:multiple sugar transport system permease protein
VSLAAARQGLAAGPSLAGGRPWRGPRRPRLPAAEALWAIAFALPYASVLLAFALYPIAYAIVMGAEPMLYRDLAEDPRYLRAVVNTLVYVGFAVNLTLFPALLVSGFFMRRRRWIKALLVVFILPWALPAAPAFLSFHWMLIGEQGLVDSLLLQIFGIEGPLWFDERWRALGCDVLAQIWKWLPFWTLVFLAGRMAIPPEIYEAADIDGADGARRFLHVTLPLLAGLYLVSTLLATLWTLGDFTAVYFVSGGAPAMASDVLATLGMRYALDLAKPQLGVAAMLSALPLLIPVVILLIRRIEMREVQL